MRSKARLGGAKMAVQSRFWSGDPPWPWSALAPGQYCAQSRWLFRDPPRPVSLRIVHCTRNSMCYRRTLCRTVVYFYFWLIYDFLLYGSYSHNLVNCLITLIIIEKKKRKKERKKKKTILRNYTALRQNNFQLVPACCFESKASHINFASKALWSLKLTVKLFGQRQSFNYREAHRIRLCKLYWFGKPKCLPLIYNHVMQILASAGVLMAPFLGGKSGFVEMCC